MSKAARSVFVFGIYMMVAGSGFLTMPNIILPLFMFPATDEVWIRIVGFLMMIIGIYYIQTSRHEIKQFFSWTVQVRPMVLACFTILVLLGLANPMLIAFGIVDFLGAVWTWLALKAE